MKEIWECDGCGFELNKVGALCPHRRRALDKVHLIVGTSQCWVPEGALWVFDEREE